MELGWTFIMIIILFIVLDIKTFYQIYYNQLTHQRPTIAGTLYVMFSCEMLQELLQMM